MEPSEYRQILDEAFLDAAMALGRTAYIHSICNRAVWELSLDLEQIYKLAYAKVSEPKVEEDEEDDDIEFDTHPAIVHLISQLHV